ncbi:hypothetical protein I552_5048 [Mycobacterium xenopi 3993]|nr:hypothetical protein I552_5048 [Mycobacterium xenopi 3993]
MERANRARRVKRVDDELAWISAKPRAPPSPIRFKSFNFGVTSALHAPARVIVCAKPRYHTRGNAWAPVPGCRYC